MVLVVADLTPPRGSDVPDNTVRVPDQISQVIGMLGHLDVPGALNIYSEDECVAWGEAPGAATEPRLGTLPLPGIALGRPDRHGGRGSG